MNPHVALDIGQHKPAHTLVRCVGPDPLQVLSRFNPTEPALVLLTNTQRDAREINSVADCGAGRNADVDVDVDARRC